MDRMKTFLALALVCLLVAGCADTPVPATTSIGGNNVGPTRVTSETPGPGPSNGATPGSTGLMQ